MVSTASLFSVVLYNRRSGCLGSWTPTSLGSLSFQNVTSVNPMWCSGCFKFDSFSWLHYDEARDLAFCHLRVCAGHKASWGQTAKTLHSYPEVTAIGRMLLRDLVTMSSQYAVWMLCRWLWCCQSQLVMLLKCYRQFMHKKKQPADKYYSTFSTMCSISVVRDSLYVAMMTPRATSVNFWMYRNVVTQLWQNGWKEKVIDKYCSQRDKMRSWGSCHWVSWGILLNVSRKLNFHGDGRWVCWHFQPWTADCLFLLGWFPARSAWTVHWPAWDLRYHCWDNRCSSWLSSEAEP